MKDFLKDSYGVGSQSFVVMIFFYRESRKQIIDLKNLLE